MDELRKKELKELQEMLNEKYTEREKLVQDIFKNKEKDKSKVTKIRKEIARISTVISEKQKEEK